MKRFKGFKILFSAMLLCILIAPCMAVIADVEITFNPDSAGGVWVTFTDNSIFSPDETYIVSHIQSYRTNCDCYYGADAIDCHDLLSRDFTGTTSTLQRSGQYHADYAVSTCKINGDECYTEEKSIDFTVPGLPPPPPPVADFEATPTSGAAPLKVTFTDMSTGVIISRKWSFGDGDTSDRQNPIHYYESPNSYDITLALCGAGGSDEAIKTINVQSPLPDLAISEVKLVQVVWDSDINSDGATDLVAGKSTAVLVRFDIKNPDKINPTIPIEIGLSFKGMQLNLHTLTKQEMIDGQCLFYPKDPTTIGDSNIIAVIDPKNMVKESDENNNKLSVPVSVKSTKKLTVGFIRVQNPGSAHKSTFTQTDMATTSQFVKKTFPIAENDFKSTLYPKVLTGTAKTGIIEHGSTYDTGVSQDIQNLQDIANKNHWDVAVGIVPDDYFTYHNCPLNSGGMTQRINGVTQKGVLVTSDTVGIAHELGHYYGLLYEEGQIEKSPGFDVKAKKFITIDYECFMGPVRPLFPWICKNSYQDLFRALILK